MAVRAALRILFSAAFLLAGTAATVTRAAVPQPYAVTLEPTGKQPLDTALHDASTLVSLEKTAPVGGFALLERARQDVGRFQIVLHSFGYYNARVDVTIEGHPLSEPALPGLIDRRSATPPVPVTAAFDPGRLFHLGTVTINGSVPPQARAALDLRPGAPAVAGDVLAARDRLLSALRDASYPLATVAVAPATLRPAQGLLDVVFDAASGPSAALGPVRITGIETMNDSFVRRRLLIHPGEKFSPQALDKARRNLLDLGVFSTVRMEPAEQLDRNGNLPMTVAVTERKLHAVDLGVAYSTDLGIDFNVGWKDRNLFGNAEQLNLLAATNLAGNATTQPGYKVSAQFIKPDFLQRDQQFELDLGALKQSLKAYDQQAVTQAARLHRQFARHWDLSAGLLGEQEDIRQEGVSRHYNLVGAPIVAKYDSTNNLLNPTTGFRARFGLTPMQSLSTRSVTFVIMEASGSGYLDLSGDGRSVLAMRGLVGKIAGAGAFSLPPDQRFYAGGSSTVRGYRYQSVGPRFPSGNPTGGMAVSAGSIELRQRILGKYGAAAFVDAGQVSANGAPFTSNWHIGAGVGVRYDTSIGPIRLDVAVPLNRGPGGDSFEVYIGIGQSF